MPDLFGSSGGGGGDGSPVNVPITPIAPPWAKNMNAATMPNMPNQIPQLARDMQDGGFVPKTAAGHKTAVNWLSKIFQPSQTYSMAPLTPNPVTPKPKTPVVTPAGPSAYNYNTAPGRR